jgi:MFS family permease
VTRLGFTPTTYGALISLNGVLVVLCELPLTTITRRFPVRRVLAAGYLLVGTGFALNLVARTVPQLAVCVVMFTCGEMLAMPVASAFVSNLAPVHLRGRYMGMFGLNSALALVIAPGIGLQLLAWNPAVLWAGCGVMAMIGAVIISMEFRTQREGLERIGTD